VNAIHDLRCRLEERFPGCYAWKRTSQGTHPSFQLFIRQLADAGLLKVKKEGSFYDCSIASLCIDGLGITRVQGEKK
jgi:hypothetical protein